MLAETNLLLLFKKLHPDQQYAALADCVLINKGDHMLEVLETLKDILQPTSEHRIQKRYTFRPMGIETRFFGGIDR